MGDEFLKKRWRPFFKELMAEELKAGGKGWKTRKRQQRALEKLSIVLARENGAMMRGARRNTFLLPYKDWPFDWR